MFFSILDELKLSQKLVGGVWGAVCCNLLQEVKDPCIQIIIKLINISVVFFHLHDTCWHFMESHKVTMTSFVTGGMEGWQSQTLIFGKVLWYSVVLLTLDLSAPLPPLSDSRPETCAYITVRLRHTMGLSFHCRTMPCGNGFSELGNRH